jgi:hypothetical protein
MEMILQINELTIEVKTLEDSLKKVREEYKEYKNAMEFYIGRGRCFEALEQYRLENK